MNDGFGMFSIVNQNLLYRIQILNSEPHKESSSSGPGSTVEWIFHGLFHGYQYQYLSKYGDKSALRLPIKYGDISALDY